VSNNSFICCRDYTLASHKLNPQKLKPHKINPHKLKHHHGKFLNLQKVNPHKLKHHRQHRGEDGFFRCLCVVYDGLCLNAFVVCCL